MTYRETIAAGVIPPMEVFSQVLGCLQFPREASWRNRFVETLGLTIDNPKTSKLVSLLDGFGEYDSRSFSILEVGKKSLALSLIIYFFTRRYTIVTLVVQEASSLGVVPCVSFKESPLLIDARKLQIHTVEVI